MSQPRFGRWATEAKQHLLKYRPKMAAQLQEQGKLDDWAEKAAERAGEEAGLSIENGMLPLEAESEAKRNHMFLPSEEDEPSLGEDPNPEPEPTPAAEITAPRTYATPDEVKQFLTRARRLLALSPEKLRDMPSPSKRIH